MRVDRYVEYRLVDREVLGNEIVVIFDKVSPSMSRRQVKDYIRAPHQLIARVVAPYIGLNKLTFAAFYAHGNSI